jgi:hypothetical protein
MMVKTFVWKRAAFCETASFVVTSLVMEWDRSTLLGAQYHSHLLDLQHNLELIIRTIQSTVATSNTT